MREKIWGRNAPSVKISIKTCSFAEGPTVRGLKVGGIRGNHQRDGKKLKKGSLRDVLRPATCYGYSTFGKAAQVAF